MLHRYGDFDEAERTAGKNGSHTFMSETPTSGRGPSAKFQSRLEAEKESKIVGGNGYRAWFIGIAPERP
jgi:hypothetical protein